MSLTTLIHIVHDTCRSYYDMEILYKEIILSGVFSDFEIENARGICSVFDEYLDSLEE